MRSRTRNRTRMTCRSFMEPAVMLMECAHHGGEIAATNQRSPRTGFCVREPRAPRDFTARPRDNVAPPTTSLGHDMIAWRHDQLTALVRFPTPLTRPAACYCCYFSTPSHSSTSIFRWIRFEQPEIDAMRCDASRYQHDSPAHRK